MNEETSSPEKDNKPGKNNSQMKIAGYNLLAFFIYGLILVALIQGGGLLIFGFLFICHVIFCVCTAIVTRKWIWFLSGVLILIIGFSTCAGFIR